MTLKRKLKSCNTCGKESYIFSKGNCKPCSALQSAVKNKVKKPRPKKKRIETITSLKKKARYWFQRFIRFRDLNELCIYGCGTRLSDIKFFDAAHYLKFELYPDAGFDELNVHGSCKGCNIRDPQLEYRRGLVLKFGQQKLDDLENKYKINRGTFKWDRSFLQDIIDKYKDLCDKIEKK